MSFFMSSLIIAIDVTQERLKGYCFLSLFIIFDCQTFEELIALISLMYNLCKYMRKCFVVSTAGQKRSTESVTVCCLYV